MRPKGSDLSPLDTVAVDTTKKEYFFVVTPDGELLHFGVEGRYDKKMPTGGPGSSVTLRG